MDKPLTFGRWLRIQTERHDPIGDFARDYVAPGAYGKCCGQFQGYKTILHYLLMTHSPCDAALDALQDAYKEYKEYRGIVRLSSPIVAHQEIYTRELKNQAERQCFEELSKEGWLLTKRGWPDFACFRNGEFITVEVKPAHDSFLKKEQYKVMMGLSKLGVKCYRWTPETKLTLVTPPKMEKGFCPFPPPLSEKEKK